MILAPMFCRRFVGRHDEIGFIMERFAASRGGRGALVLIGGDAGVGKTRLLAQARTRFEKAGARYLLGQCLEHAQAPLAPIAELLREADLVDSGILRSTPGLRAGLSRLLPEPQGWPADEVGSSATTGDARGQFAAIGAALCRVSRSRPIVAVIEDAHWADLATLDCLQFLSERIAAARVLVLVTYRSDELHRSHPLALTLGRIRPAAGIWRLTLGPLREPEMQALQDDVLDGHAGLPIPTLREIRTLAEGNPLFAEELLRHASERGGNAGDLPLTVRATVLERLVHLDNEQRDVLVHAAVYGRRFVAAVLAEVMERPLESIGTALRRARDLQLIVEEGDGSVRYAFRHALVREALYSELLVHERRPLHRRIALRLEAAGDAHHGLADLAYHWWASHEPAKALEYSERAGDAAMALLAYKDAALHFERAIEHAPSGSRSAALRVKLGTTLGLAGDPRRASAAIEHAAAYFEQSGAAAKASDLYRQIGWFAWVVSDTDAALAGFERSRACAQTVPHDPCAYAALVNLAMFHASAGNAAAAAQCLDEAEAFTGSPAPSDVSVFFDARAHVRSLEGEISRSIADSRSGIDAAWRAGDVRRVINGHINLTRAAAAGGLLDVARHACDDALRFARESFVTQREFMALVNRGLVEVLAGEYAAARMTIDEAVQLGSDLDPALVLTRLGDFAVPLGLRLQDPELVNRFARQDTLELAFRSREPIRIAPLTAAFVELAVSSGDFATARALLHRGLAAISIAEASPALMLLAAAHAEPADVATARALLTRWSQPPDNRAGHAYLALFDAAWGSRSGQAQRQSAQAAAEAFNSLRLPYYEALARELEGKPERALALHRQIGNRRDAGRLEREMANRQGRTKEQLTGREREIARLVAQGKSNAEIAAHFVLSHRTVENHVSAVLHKFNVRSRTELALRMQPETTAPNASSA